MFISVSQIGGSISEKDNRVTAMVEVVERIRQLDDILIEDYKDRPFIHRSTVIDTLKWDSEILEKQLNIKLPRELVSLWDLVSELRIYEDINYGQWGLLIWSPHKTLLSQSTTVEAIGQQLLPGDLVVGEFRGDLDRVLLRCDPKSTDFGHVIIVDPIDERNDWRTVAHSLSEFLERFLLYPAEKYWEVQT